MQILLSQCIYGGHNGFDLLLFNSLVNRFFSVISFEDDFPHVANIDELIGKNIVMPEGIW